MKRYGVRIRDRVYNRCKGQLKGIVAKLQRSTGFYQVPHEELNQEVTILFYNNFEEYYEDDNQYLRFLFICLKNRIRNMQLKEYNYRNRFVALKTSEDNEDDYSATWGQVADPECTWTKYEIKEICDKAKEMIKQTQYNDIYHCLTQGYSIKKTARLTRRSVCEVIEIVKNEIQPLLIEIGIKHEIRTSV
jgi:hypothetical protein